jgi:hypothetical protein
MWLLAALVAMISILSVFVPRGAALGVKGAQHKFQNTISLTCL